MKNLLKFLSLLLIASSISLFVTSCGDDDDEETAFPTVSDTSYTAKVDGVVWEADNISVTNTPATKITLIGIESTTGTRITLTYSGPFTTGTVAIGSTFVAEYRNAAGTPFGGISGSITFTKFNTATRVISATFNCNVKDNNNNVTKVITNGVIENIEY